MNVPPPSSSSNANTDVVNALKACDIQHLLREKIALLTGGRDRNGRPVITFPSRENAEKTTFEELRHCLQYLHAIPCDGTKELGFVALIDMRHGMTWNAVKPVLKTLHENFPGVVNLVLILKPEKFWDSFWEKHKASIASAKYKFEIILISLDNLPKYVDNSQLTNEFDGTLPYDHEEWLEMRMELESFIWRSLDVLRIFDEMRNDLECSDVPTDVDGAKSALEEHTKVKKRISKAPVEQLEQEGQQLSQRLTGVAGDEGSTGNGPADSDYGSAGRDSQMNPDFTAAAPHILSLLENLRSTRNNLYGLWQNKKQKLDQCFQLKLFEQDAEKMFQWLRQHIELFLANYADIGDSHDTALKAQTQHEQFTRAAMNTYVNISHIMTVAHRLLEVGHYASPVIQANANRLERDWKLFMSALDMRSAVLTMSLQFHFKANQYLANVDDWALQCYGESDVACTVPTLEASIHEHQQLMESITQSYGEIHTTSKRLLYQLDCLVQLCHCPMDDDLVDDAVRDGKALVHALKNPPPLTIGGNAVAAPTPPSSSPPTTPDYTIGATHVLDVIHQLLAQQRQLEQKWQARRVKLHQKLALLLFQQDVKQVLDWLDKHGEIFLRKNTGVGKTLQRARALQRSQQHFENVAKNTYSNAEKLLAAAEDLAGTGECQPEEIYGIAQQLRSRISTFAKRVQARRNLLNFSVLFHTHYQEIMKWFDEVDRLDADIACVGETLQQCEFNVDQWVARRDATFQATMTAKGEGEQLLCLLRQQSTVENTDNSDCIACIEQMWCEIDQRHLKLREQWKTQKLQLDLGIQFRVFEQDCATVISQLDSWCEDMKAMTISVVPSQAEKVLPLHNENTSQVHQAMLEVMQHAQQLIQDIDTSQIRLIIAADGSNVVDCILNLADRVRQHEEGVMNLGEQVRAKLEQILSLGQLQALASQVVAWINNEEQMLAATFAVPSSLVEAEQLQSEHKQFQLAIEKTNESALALQQKAKIMLTKDQCEPNRVHNLVEDVITRWRRLIALTEERHKLLTSACTYYKIFDQVLPILDSLEVDYQQNRDWCSLYGTATQNMTDVRLMTPRGGGVSSSASTAVVQEKIQDKVSFMSELLSKHMENKERFLRSCTYARKNSEIFLKYLGRSLHQPLQQSAIFSAKLIENKVAQALENLHSRENRILQLWTQKKRQLDQCQEFVLLEASARQVLDWIQDEGEMYLKTRPGEPFTRTPIDKLMLEHESFVEKVKEQREKVRIFLECGDGMVNKDAQHIHSGDICQSITAVRKSYTEFSQKMDRYKTKLEIKLGKPDVVQTRDLALDRHSDPALEAKYKEAAHDETNSKRKSLKQKEHVMAEILSTEKIYVNDLETCLKFYYNGMEQTPLDQTPTSIRGKLDAIFLNLKEIYKFHSECFLKELEKYESLPENVGHCFLTFAKRFQMYVFYCRNKFESMQLILPNDVNNFFAEIQIRNGLSLQLAAYLIKPIQRITKYQLLLQALLKCCEESKEEIKDAFEVMCEVPKKADNILALSNVQGCSDLDSLGDVILQEKFTVWDSRQIIKKGRERHVFLFDLCILFCKNTDPQVANGKNFVYKNRLLTSEINITEHLEFGDECRFALWTGRIPNNENRTIFKAPNLEVKIAWVRRLRELISDRILHFELPHLPPPKLRPTSTATSSLSDRNSRTSKDSDPRESQLMTTEINDNCPTAGDRTSLRSCASSTTSNETEISKIPNGDVSLVIEDHQPTTTTTRGEVSAFKGETVEILEYSPSSPDWCLVRIHDESSTVREGLLPTKKIKFASLTNRYVADGTTTPINNNVIIGQDSNHQCSPTDGLIGDGQGGMKRKSLKKWFAPGGGRSSKAVQRQLSADSASTQANRQTDVKELDESTATTAVDHLSRKGGSVYVKLKDQTGGDNNKTATASSSSLVGSSSSSQLLLSRPSLQQDSTDLVSQSEDECSMQQDETIEMPPPMDRLASEKLAVNGQQEVSSTIGPSVQPATAPDSAEEMAQEIEQMVRLRLVQPNGSTDKTVVEGADGLTPTLADDACPTSESSTSQLSPADQAKAKRHYVLMELVETERDYVRDLGSIIEGYIGTMKSMELPDDMKGKDKFVFANIEAIYEFHKSSFLKEIEKCLEDYDAVGRAFVRYERRLQIYVKYCENKPKSEYLVSEYESFFNDLRQKLGHRLNLADLLIKPVQRIMKYQLLLKDILKFTERAGESTELLKKAMQVMHVVPKSCDDMMHVGRLQNFEGKITAQGKLVHQGTLLVSDNPSNQIFKAKDRRLFLFEQSLIIADCILPKKEFSNPNYIYKSHMQINKMSIDADVPNEPLRFILKNRDPTGPQDILLQCGSVDEKQEWMRQIKQLLDMQNDFLKALQHPIAFQKGLKDETKEETIAAATTTTTKQKNTKSPILNRIAHLKTSNHKNTNAADPSASAPANHNSLSSPANNGPSSSNVVESPNSLNAGAALPTSPNAVGAAASPKSKSKLFDSFRNPLKSKSGAAVAIGKSPTSPPPINLSSQRAKILCNYSPLRKDEIVVKCGERVSLLDWTDGRFFALKDGVEMESQCCLGGWIPDYLVKLIEFEDIVEKRHVARRSNKLDDTPESTTGQVINPFPELHKLSVLLNSQQTKNQSTLLNKTHKKLSFVEPLKNMQIANGQKVVLMVKCQDSSVVFKWSGPIILSEDSENLLRYRIDNGQENFSTLTIFECRPEDAGQYSCTAANIDGHTVTAMLLTVIESPSAPGRPSVNHLPDTTHVQLHWDPPGNINRNIPTWYTVLYRTEDTEEFQVASDGATSTSVTVKDLEQGPTYWFAVRAYNECFVGTLSVPSKPIVVMRNDGHYQNQIQWQKGFGQRFAVLSSDVGRGRFASVRQLICRQTNTMMAAKCFQTVETSKETVQNEYCILAQLKHPNIINSYGLIDDDGELIILLKWVPGPQLFLFVAHLGIYSENTVQRFMKQLLDTLCYLHDRKIAHLDIKPENLLVDPNQNEAKLILIDFGDSSKIHDSHRLPFYQGNIEYASPEQLDSGVLSTSIDIWSLGVVTYAFLTGFSPFLDETVEETRSNVLRGNCSYPETLSKKSRQFIEKILNVDPNKRPSAAQCLEHQWMKNPIEGPPLSSERLLEYVERRKYETTKKSFLLPL